MEKERKIMEISGTMKKEVSRQIKLEGEDQNIEDVAGWLRQVVESSGMDKIAAIRIPVSGKADYLNRQQLVSGGLYLHQDNNRNWTIGVNFSVFRSSLGSSQQEISFSSGLKTDSSKIRNYCLNGGEVGNNSTSEEALGIINRFLSLIGDDLSNNEMNLSLLRILRLGDRCSGDVAVVDKEVVFE